MTEKTPIEKFLEYLNTPEGDAEMTRHFEQMAKKEERRDARIEKANTLFNTLTKIKLNRLIRKIIKKEEVFQHFWYYRGEYRVSNTMGILLATIQKYGAKHDGASMFSVGIWDYKQYQVEVLQGQGSVYILYHKGSRIYTSN